jgi:HAMP domain-containing protein
MPAPQITSSAGSAIDNAPRSGRRRRTLWTFVATLVVLGIAVALLAYRYNPLRRFPERAHEATAVVDAVYRFRNDTGLWPEDLLELIPDYIHEIPAEWEFIWGGYDNARPSALRLLGPLHTKLEYTFLASVSAVPAFQDTHGWRATCEGDSLPVHVRQFVPKLVPRDENDRLKLALRILEQRVQREPNVEDHKIALARYSSR